jgi:hypothetical protein
MDVCSDIVASVRYVTEGNEALRPANNTAGAFAHAVRAIDRVDCVGKIAHGRYAC